MPVEQEVGNKPNTLFKREATPFIKVERSLSPQPLIPVKRERSDTPENPVKRERSVSPNTASFNNLNTRLRPEHKLRKSEFITQAPESPSPEPAPTEDLSPFHREIVGLYERHKTRDWRWKEDKNNLLDQHGRNDKEFSAARSKLKKDGRI